MNSDLLDYFLRVCELGSISRAAADLNLSQPALSRHIAALEHEMGGPLFTRTRGGVVLTDAGRLLADRARPLLRQFAMVKEQVGEKAAGQLTMGVPQAWQNVFTSPFVAKLLKTHPTVTMRVYDGVSNILREYMSAGILDLCVMPFEELHNPSYTQTALVREPLIAIGNAASGMQPRQPLATADLDGLNLVMPGRANVLRQRIEHALLRKGMRFRLAIETDTLDLCLEFARVGIGVTIAPASSLQARPPDASLAWAPIRGLYVTWALYENKARAYSKAIRVGRRLLTSTIAERVADGCWFGAELVSARAQRARIEE